MTKTELVAKFKLRDDNAVRDWNEAFLNFCGPAPIEARLGFTEERLKDLAALVILLFQDEEHPERSAEPVRIEV